MATKTGNSLDNWLRGTAEDDTLNGGGGNDVLWGLGGYDILRGGDDHDVLIGGPGDDDLYGGAGNDVLIGGEGDMDRFWGGAGADVLLGSGGANTRAYYDQSPAGVTVNLATGRGQGGDAEGDVLIGIPNVVGSSHGDTLTGDEQDNYFQLGGGADVVDGGGGIDTVSYHYLRSNQSGVTVDLGVTDAEGWTTVTGGDGSGGKLKNIENLDGGHGSDTLTGDQNANKLYGGRGHDALEGRAGADTLDGGLDDDYAVYQDSPGGVTVDLTLTGPQATENNHDAAGDTLIGIENLVGSDHSDRLTGDDGENWLVGGAGIDYLYGGNGNDFLWGEAAYPRVPFSRNSSEQVYGYSLPNFLYGGDGHDYLRGGAGNDTLEGGDGHDWLSGYAGHDWLKGGDGNDQLYGGTGTDVLEGGDGADLLAGRAGIDHLYGGTGADRFFFGQDSVVDTGNEEETRTLSDETDTVKDFSQSEGDRLDLRGLKAHSLFTGGTTPGRELSLLETKGAAFTGVKGQVKWWQDGGQTHVQVDLDGEANADGGYDAEFQVTLDGLHTLTDTDLILA